jgi:predicted N-formylglutamate amidohydrolase
MDLIGAAEEIDGDFDGRLVFTCEHASKRLPDPWTWPEEDRWLVDTHWASDIGAAAFTRRVARLMNAPAVLSRFSRLLIDPNRPLDSETLFRQNADGRTVHLNEALLDAERARRIDGFYHPYHAAVSAMVERSRGDTVFSIHTFTDTYEGDARTLEIGVLFDHDEEPAERLVRHLEESGFHVLRNQPWSGKAGLAYSPVRHAQEFGRRALEIEARQDLIVDESFSARLAGALATFFS